MNMDKPGLRNILVPMLLRGNLWAALGWLLLERQVCILTRKRGNEEEWRHSREGGNPHSREGENLRHPGPLCSPYSTTFLVPMLLRGNLWAALEWLLLEEQVCILTRKRGNEEEWRHSREGGNPHSREGENLRHPGPLCSPYSTTFLVPMLLRGNLWAALGWLLLEEQVCILTRKRGNEEEWRHSREGGNPHSREGENLRHPGPLCSPYSTTFLVPMLLRGNLWAALEWLLLERQVCIPTRERGNEETEET